MKNDVINVESFLNELISCQDPSYKLSVLKENADYEAFVPHYLKQLRGEISCLKQQAAIREQRNALIVARRAAYQERNV